MSDTFAVRLPARLRPLLEAEARDHGFSDVAEYLTFLVRANTAAEESDRELESALLRGIDSGDPIPVDDAFWADVRRRARARVARGTRG